MTAENIKGECTVPLLLQDFVNGSTVEYTEELHYEGIMLRGYNTTHNPHPTICTATCRPPAGPRRALPLLPVAAAGCCCCCCCCLHFAVIWILTGSPWFVSFRPDGGPVTVTFKLEFIPPAGADEPEPES